jgi:hypothetical protein
LLAAPNRVAAFAGTDVSALIGFAGKSVHEPIAQIGCVSYGLPLLVRGPPGPVPVVAPNEPTPPPRPLAPFPEAPPSPEPPPFPELVLFDVMNFMGAVDEQSMPAMSATKAMDVRARADPKRID